MGVGDGELSLPKTSSRMLAPMVWALVRRRSTSWVEQGQTVVVRLGESDGLVGAQSGGSPRRVVAATADSHMADSLRKESSDSASGGAAILVVETADARQRDDLAYLRWVHGPGLRALFG